LNRAFGTIEPLPAGRYFLSENYLRGASASGNYLSLRFQAAKTYSCSSCYPVKNICTKQL
jgi:hypothetical protein